MAWQKEEKLLISSHEQQQSLGNLRVCFCRSTDKDGWNMTFPFLRNSGILIFCFTFRPQAFRPKGIRPGIFNPWATCGLVQLAGKPGPCYAPSASHCSSAHPQSAPTAQQHLNICALLTLSLQPRHGEGTVHCQELQQITVCFLNLWQNTVL